MSTRIVLVGGLPDEASRHDILSELLSRSDESVTWDWMQANEASGFRPPVKYLRELLAQLQQAKSDESQSMPNVVILPQLNGQTTNKLYQLCEPLHVPPLLETWSAVLDWLFSPDANLIPKREWMGNDNEAALAAILAKLIRNKSWNNSVQGHEWTKEADLLGQAPVCRNQNQVILVTARSLLSRLDHCLLISKGGTAGTPKEWCIRYDYLPIVKKVILSQSFKELSTIDELKPVYDRISKDSDRKHRIDGTMIRERERDICRTSHGNEAKPEPK